MPIYSTRCGGSAKPSTGSTNASTSKLVSSTPTERTVADGWGDPGDFIPNPWVALSHRIDLVLHHDRIAEPARYYDDLRIIVLRRGLLLREQRRYLWHEIAHADRRDRACETGARVERRVDEAAMRLAMPMCSLRWAFGHELERHRIAGMLKLPEAWVQARLHTLTPSEATEIRHLQEGLWAEEVA